MKRRPVLPTFTVGAHVFYRGSSGIVTAVNPDGTYTIDLTYGETVTARAYDMAHRY